MPKPRRSPSASEPEKVSAYMARLNILGVVQDLLKYLTTHEDIGEVRGMRRTYSGRE
jgi:hypothetical protein